MSVKLLTEQCFELPRLKGGYTGSSEATLVEMPHCLKSRVTAHMYYFYQTLTQVRIWAFCPLSYFVGLSDG